VGTNGKVGEAVIKKTQDQKKKKKNRGNAGIGARPRRDLKGVNRQSATKYTGAARLNVARSFGKKTDCKEVEETNEGWKGGT